MRRGSLPGRAAALGEHGDVAAVEGGHTGVWHALRSKSLELRFTVKSSLATMYHDGLDLHAVPFTFF